VQYFDGRPEGRRQLGRLRRWEDDNIKMELQGFFGGEGVRGWTGLICLRIGTGGGRLRMRK
jgi:hypothetical protein